MSLSIRCGLTWLLRSNYIIQYTCKIVVGMNLEHITTNSVFRISTAPLPASYYTRGWHGSTIKSLIVKIYHSSITVTCKHGSCNFRGKHEILRGHTLVGLLITTMRTLRASCDSLWPRWKTMVMILSRWWYIWWYSCELWQSHLEAGISTHD